MCNPLCGRGAPDTPERRRSRTSFGFTSTCAPMAESAPSLRGCRSSAFGSSRPYDGVEEGCQDSRDLREKNGGAGRAPAQTEVLSRRKNACLPTTATSFQPLRPSSFQRTASRDRLPLRFSIRTSKVSNGGASISGSGVESLPPGAATSMPRPSSLACANTVRNDDRGSAGPVSGIVRCQSTALHQSVSDSARQAPTLPHPLTTERSAAAELAEDGVGPAGHGGA